MHEQSNIRRSIELAVGQIAQNTIDIAEISCDQFRLRVKRKSLFCCSIDLLCCDSGRQRSNTELATDSHSRQVHAEDHAPKQLKTPRSCGLAPSEESGPSSKRFSGFDKPVSSAGSSPAFSFGAPRAVLRARHAEFISVSGQCAARSALNSDMRIKRISGGAAATEHLRAPMNSPRGFVSRVSFST